MRNYGCIIKLIILVIVIMGIVLLISQCTGGSCIHRIEKGLPGVDWAPWQIITPTHIYYAKSVNDAEIEVILTDWYEWIDGEWIKRDGSLTLSRNVYGKIDIMRR